MHLVYKGKDKQVKIFLLVSAAIYELNINFVFNNSENNKNSTIYNSNISSESSHKQNSTYNI